MLNVDYKILSKALALRMKPVLKYITDDDQSGFMESRNIATNMRKVIEVVKYTKDNQFPALVVTMDLEKCFDHIEHGAVRGSLEYFNFGPKHINWVMLLLNDFELCVQNNSNISSWLTPTRSVHQGCCLAPYLYLLCGQVLSHKIKENPYIHGINMYDIVALLSQFADDTTLFLSYDLVTLSSALVH